MMIALHDMTTSLGYQARKLYQRIIIFSIFQRSKLGLINKHK